MCLFKLSEGEFTAPEESFFFAARCQELSEPAFGIGELFKGETAILAGDLRSWSQTLNDVIVSGGRCEKSCQIIEFKIVQNK